MKQMEPNPLVSVCMIAFNHEAYISQAIESVLMQKARFPIELVIGEDCSTDKTRDICLSYDSTSAVAIRVLPRTANLGMMANFADTLEKCTGKYIALCEGDDYWTDSQKLQKQFDFMEANKDIYLCYHNAQILTEGEDSPSGFLVTTERNTFEFKDVVAKNFGYVPTASCFYRASALRPFPDSLPPIDWVLLLLASRQGSIRFINEVMSVYRKHEGGWTNKLSVQKASDVAFITAACKEYFAPLHAGEFDEALAHWYADICFVHFENGDRKQFAAAFSEFKKYWKWLPRRVALSLYSRKWLSQIGFMRSTIE